MKIREIEVNEIKDEDSIIYFNNGTNQLEFEIGLKKYDIKKSASNFD